MTKGGNAVIDLRIQYNMDKRKNVWHGCKNSKMLVW